MFGKTRKNKEKSEHREHDIRDGLYDEDVLNDENLTEEDIQEGHIQLSKQEKKAKELLGDRDKMDRFLEKLEKKLRVVPLAGSVLSNIPTLAQLLKAYLKGQYKEIPMGSIVALVGALIYFVSPIDVIPDFLPGVGLLDDAGVIAACLKLIQSDVDEFRAWRAEQDRRAKDE